MLPWSLTPPGVLRQSEAGTAQTLVRDVLVRLAWACPASPPMRPLRGRIQQGGGALPRLPPPRLRRGSPARKSLDLWVADLIGWFQVPTSTSLRRRVGGLEKSVVGPITAA